MAFEKYIIPEDDEQKNMALHLFIAILSEYLNGKKSASEAKTAIESYLETTLSTNETSDIVASIAYIDAGSDNADKLGRLDELYHALVCAAHDTWYNSLTLLRARLNWSEPD